MCLVAPNLQSVEQRDSRLLLSVKTDVNPYNISKLINYITLNLYCVQKKKTKSKWPKTFTVKKDECFQLIFTVIFFLNSESVCGKIDNLK